MILTFCFSACKKPSITDGERSSLNGDGVSLNEYSSNTINNSSNQSISQKSDIETETDGVLTPIVNEKNELIKPISASAPQRLVKTVYATYDTVITDASVVDF